MRFLQGLLLSLGIHGLLVWGSQFLPAPESFQTQNERIEFEVVDRTPSQIQGQVIRQPMVPDDSLTEQSEDPLRFLSERRQSVRKQMRAEQSGKTENRAPNPNRSARRPARQPSVQNRDLFQLPPRPLRDPDGIAATQQRQQNSLPRLDLPTGFSTVGESLPRELEVGSFTSLNTDRYLFYSFFMRVEDLIRYNWESYVKDTINRTPRQAFLAQNRDTWVTNVEIQLRPDGQFHRAYLLKGSGISGFDWAAVDAFSRARFFPNPPQEMVESDGLIRLKYSFAVQYRPTALGSAPRDRNIE